MLPLWIGIIKMIRVNVPAADAVVPADRVVVQDQQARQDRGGRRENVDLKVFPVLLGNAALLVHRGSKAFQARKGVRVRRENGVNKVR